jgi:hypothetical protein
MVYKNLSKNQPTNPKVYGLRLFTVTSGFKVKNQIFILCVHINKFSYTLTKSGYKITNVTNTV